MRPLGSQMELLQLAKKYVTLFTSSKFNKPSANHDIQRQECHISLNFLVSMVNQKPLSSLFLSENLSKMFSCPSKYNILNQRIFIPVPQNY